MNSKGILRFLWDCYEYKTSHGCEWSNYYYKDIPTSFYGHYVTDLLKFGIISLSPNDNSSPRDYFNILGLQRYDVKLSLKGRWITFRNEDKFKNEL